MTGMANIAIARLVGKGQHILKRGLLIIIPCKHYQHRGEAVLRNT